MSEQQLFVEVFPLLETALKPLAAYVLAMDGERDPAEVGGRLAQRLRAAYGGRWLWLDGRIITDNPRTGIELMITLDILKGETDTFKHVAGIEPDEGWGITAEIAAQFAVCALIPEHEDALAAAMRGMGAKLTNAVVQREVVAKAWVVEDYPALSLSIHSHIYYDKLLSKHMATLEKPADVIGLEAADNTSTLRGTITALVGTAGEQRARLLSLTKRPALQDLIAKAADDEPVVRLHTAYNGDYDFVASALKIALRPEDMETFGVNPAHAHTAQQIKPAQRAQLIRAASEVLKTAGVIGSAYNAREIPDLFLVATFEANLRFAKHRVRRYDAETIGGDLTTAGVYRRAKRFEDEPIKLAVINALGDEIDDFIEALRRAISKDFGFTLDLVRERKVRVLTPKNLQTAVRDIQKEVRDVVLAFFPDSAAGASDDASDTYVKQQTVGRGIPALIVHQAALDRPEVMGDIISGLIARAGNLPYVLAEPLDYVDFIVGMDIAREEKKSSKTEDITCIARIYKSDGDLVGYALQSVTIAQGEPIPLTIMQNLFPAPIFGKARIIVHYAGYLRADERAMFAKWRKAAGTQFYLVEIAQNHAARLYAAAGKAVQAAAWGSAFRLSPTEAFLVADRAVGDDTPQPLHVRSTEPFQVEFAMHSVLAFTFLHYGALHPPKLPVTVQHSEYIAEAVSHGIKPDKLLGDAAFWL